MLPTHARQSSWKSLTDTPFSSVPPSTASLLYMEQTATRRSIMREPSSMALALVQPPHHLAEASPHQSQADRSQARNLSRSRNLNSNLNRSHSLNPRHEPKMTLHWPPKLPHPTTAMAIVTATTTTSKVAPLTPPPPAQAKVAQAKAAQVRLSLHHSVTQ